jgi:hypothetical protein
MEAKTMEIEPAKPQEIAVPVQAQQADFMPVMSMEMALQRRSMLVQFTRQIMVENQDFGVIPGTGTKPALLKAGAEKLCHFFGLEPEFNQVVEDVDWTGERHGGEVFYYIRYSVRLHRGGRVLGVGEGSCNSWESKYRWRQGARKCPKCGQEAIIAGKEEFGGGWLCWKKKNGCGAQFKDDDPAIKGQTVGRIPNPDIADVVNTIQKMAQKRALVAAVLIATGASEFYTQDVEDAGLPQGVGSEEKAAAVRDRKLAELRQTAKAAESVPAPVQRLWERMGGSKERIKDVLSELYADLKEAAGTETGRGIFDDIIKRYGAGDPVAKVGLARRTVYELWKALEGMRERDSQVEMELSQEPEVVYAD